MMHTYHVHFIPGTSIAEAPRAKSEVLKNGSDTTLKMCTSSLVYTSRAQHISARHAAVSLPSLAYVYQMTTYDMLAKQFKR